MWEPKPVTTDKTYFFRKFMFRWGISAPGLFAQIVFGWMPLIVSILMAFQNFNFHKSEWCGLDNFKAVLNDPIATPFSLTNAEEHFKSSVSYYTETHIAAPNTFLSGWYKVRSFYFGMGIAWRNTIYYTILILGLTFLMPIFVAIFLMEMPPWLIRIMMLMWFVPISDMASTIILKYFYNVDYGLLNGLIKNFYDFIGKPEAIRIFPRWLNSPDLAMLCIVLPQLIMYMPGLVYITSLQGIPQDLYDAAEIDGCGFFQKIWHVTLPRLRPVIATMLVINLISAFQVFGTIMIMTQGGPANKTISLAYYVYKLAFEYVEVGKGNALAVMFFLFLITLTFIQRKLFPEDIDSARQEGSIKKFFRKRKERYAANTANRP
ncbi:MAG: hypothetical protein A2268_09910 [Candidatus Raymondbacteria bacterium RifOxyA12_full_50_37]|uniref:ABC transmembrane type-1 domain-containing protein n=1 Tax=Candidatus Raymondbacteria bacterium RIFOXYD12_FULL_49_13 TaxID=1817890 RepID=A0A1F7F4C0_UNCRA|nr:MAG: hypothetical protein A2268_09910 [Candidatus Raymondbacteria bacterium RifOxyA12_full_50_37]OGJ93848.1 MAG: hypothetical protein A2248_06390 [Candidatus Raymondbacteria bacterium RIFOXYA2_FULL_49_16]OGJ97317.1 MAG: hypothetical protein A2487_16435 [Candidatus Raymondbacteria bacterium RifOxyC12_full_50_8]OGJ98284.1 MAG: hypothetical protein A2453_00780 [Candidatus Raymondbacteria bacterium RIFOXYC2_FULL_50_21]OGJ99554.1 MAG: hypothetical protein A2350_10045 [Candidatus Raymondbacteria b